MRADTLGKLSKVADLLDPTPADKYFYNPVAWLDEFIDWGRVGKTLTPYQKEIIAEIPIRKRVAIRGPHGLGKTAMVALVVIWFCLTRDGQDWKVLTTASVWRQLEKYLWPEIKKWLRLVRWDKLGRPPLVPERELQTLGIKLKTGEASAIASDNHTAIEGAHADHLLYVLDEAKAIPNATFDAVEGAFSGAGDDTTQEAYAIMISTPGDPNGRFHDVHKRKPGFEDWWVRHVTKEEAIAAGRISEAWVAARARQWGEASAVFQNRVEGEFWSGDADGLIPLGWVELANDRWRDWQEMLEKLPNVTRVACDPARTGDDKTIMFVRRRNYLEEPRETSLEDTMTTTGRLIGIVNAYRWMEPEVVIDVIGIGAGIVDRVRELGVEVWGFNAAAGSDQLDIPGELGFVNQRSAAWWTMRELLDPANEFDIALPPHDRLIGDLTVPKWKVTSGGRIQIESKDDIYKRLGRSTDFGDACVMSFALPLQEEVNGVIVYDNPVTISPF